jgi:alpha-amylase/alpha-mannosidase (GH57 family)
MLQFQNEVIPQTFSSRPVQVCIHGHFYQPPRENPYTGEVPVEFGAEPFHDFNEKINAECYRPNALAGNFERISFNLGPTLAAWIEKNDIETYRRIIESERKVYRQFGFGNGLAQNYNHTIMPLMKYDDARLQIEWGILDFERRFGHRPEGMWLAETAASTWVLDIMAQCGLKFVILAPWQADAASLETINLGDRAVLQSELRQKAIDEWRTHEINKLASYYPDVADIEGRINKIRNAVPILPERIPEPYDVSEPYLVELSEGRSIVAFFYNGKLSGDVSFRDDATADAGHFVSDWILPEVNVKKQASGRNQLIMVATDGELYGHHKGYRDHFLRHLTETSLAEAGLQLTFPSLYLRLHPPRRRIKIHDNSSWSCHHGVQRWSTGCGCTWGDSGWKPILRRAFDVVALEVDRLFAEAAPNLFADPQEALRYFLLVWQGKLSEGDFLAHYLKPERKADFDWALNLLRAQMYKHQMYTSCAWFFEDIDRIEPKNAKASASIIFRLLGRKVRQGLRAEFETILLEAKSQHTGL